MRKRRFILFVLISAITLTISADAITSSKELNKLRSAIAKASRKGLKEVAKAEAAAELVYQTHPEETGDAHYLLGELYSRAIKEEVCDYPKAMQLLRQSLTELSEGNIYRGYAYYNIAYMYSKGLGFTQNYDSAFVYFDKAQQKNKAHVAGYAKLLEAGYGVARDPIAAMQAYAEGIQAGAQQLFLCYYPILYALDHLKKGDLDKESYDKFLRYTVEMDFGDREKAMKNIRESAAAGYLPALAELGSMLCSGENGTNKNMEEGLRMLKQAADAGYAPACHNYATYNFNYEVNDKPGGMFKGKKMQLEMAPYYQRAADQGFAPSEYAVGNTYVNGLTGVVDVVRGYRYLALAERHGYTAATFLKNQVAIAASVKSSIDADVAKVLTLKESIAKMSEEYSKMPQMAELANPADEGSSAEEGALDADFYQSQYNRYARRVERELKSDNPRKEMIESTLQKMKDIVQQAKDKGFSISRSTVEDTKL